MRQVGRNIYTNFQPSQQISNKKVSVLLLGLSGVGKSRLVNNLCGSSQKVGVDRKGITKQLFFGKSSNLGIDLLVCDTPAINQKQIENSILLRRTLRYFDWNTVVIIAKLTARFEDDTISELFRLSKFFRKESQRVIFLVSYADIMGASQIQDILRNFHESLEQNQIKQNVLIFSNQNSDFNELSKILYQTSSQKESKNFELQDKLFCRSFGYNINTDPKKELLDQIMGQIRQERQRYKDNKDREILSRQRMTDILNRNIQNQNDEVKKQIGQVINLVIEQFLFLDGKNSNIDLNRTAESIELKQDKFSNKIEIKQDFNKIKNSSDNITKYRFRQRNNSQYFRAGSNICEKVQPQYTYGQFEVHFINGKSQRKNYKKLQSNQYHS